MAWVSAGSVGVGWGMFDTSPEALGIVVLIVLGTGEMVATFELLSDVT